MAAQALAHHEGPPRVDRGLLRPAVEMLHPACRRDGGEVGRAVFADRWGWDPAILGEWRAASFPPVASAADASPLVQALVSLPGAEGEAQREARRSRDRVDWRLGESPSDQ
eukprot:13276020-Alexandrium_andersonii.AAC.1